MTPLSLVTSTKYGPSPSRSPEYYKDLDENHVPLPTVASDIWAFGCVIVNVSAETDQWIEYFDPYDPWYRHSQSKLLSSLPTTR